MKIICAVIGLAFVIASCKSPEDRTGPEAVTGVELGHAKINDIDISFDNCGDADTTLLFLHGWCINKDYWNDQRTYFCKKYRVVTLDLPGFGESGKNRSEWTFEQYAEDINEYIRSRQLKNVILIGHSMSGDILLLMDVKYPGSVAGIIGIDNLKSPGMKNTKEQNAETEAFFAIMGKNFSETVQMYASQNLFPPTADTNIVQRVINDFKKNDSLIAIKVLRSLVDISQKESVLMQQLTHKLYLVNSDSDSTEIDALKKYCKASAAVEYVHGTGHYPMIENPNEFNKALERTLAMIGREKKH